MVIGGEEGEEGGERERVGWGLVWVFFILYVGPTYFFLFGLLRGMIGFSHLNYITLKSYWSM